MPKRRTTRGLAAVTAIIAMTAPSLPVPSAFATAGGDKPHREITDDVRKVDGKLRLFVKVTDYPDRRTFLEKKNCKRCHWHNLRSRRTNDRSKVSYRIGAPTTGQWFFRVYTPETKRWAISYSRTYRTFSTF